MSRVLIVDDSLTVRMDIGDGLADVGIDAVPCHNLASARAVVAAGDVALIVLDRVLPDGDGLDFLRDLRSSSATMRIPVLLLSNAAEVRSRVRGMDAGADEYIGKPYDLDYLVARVRALLVPAPRDSDAGRRVLVIDDSATFRDELRSALERVGYRVRGAETGEEGLTLAAVERPDAVIVDGLLPGIDGATVIRRLKSDAALRGTPCLLLTAVEGTADELRALEAGADAYVRKSDDLALILGRLAALLRRVVVSDRDATPSLLAPKRVLAVDDSSTYLQEISRLLRRDGYDVVLAPSGEDALDLLTVQPVDCILLDMMMPGLSGEETCRRIKQGVDWRQIPLIMLTARDDRDAMLAGINAGADDFISKAVDFEVLKARLRAQLRRKHYEDEARRAREQLIRKDTEARFLRLVQSNIIGVIFGDMSGRLTEANDAFLTMIDRTRAELDAGVLRLPELAPPDRRERMLAALSQLRRDGTATPFETMIIRRDGSRLPIVLGLVIMDTSDLIVGFVLDRTEQKLAEEQLHRYTAALADANRELRIARDAAEALARAKADFLASMSHEIRTPMNAVIGMTGLLQDTALTELQREFVDTIRASGEHLLAVIGNILDFSKFDGSRVELEHSPFDLRTCLAEGLEIVAHLISEKDLDLVCIDDPRIPRTILGDSSRLRQIVVNLLSNAVKFTERGEILVESSLLRTIDNSHEIRVEVRDTGIGLSEAQRARLFQPFVQAETSTTRKYGGTGLGLAICKFIAEAMGGSIGVDSTPGLGSTFWFTFRAGHAPNEMTVDHPAPQLRGRRVLVVDDNAAHLRILVRQLESWGMEPLGLTSPLAALERLRGGDEFDVAVIDHRMAEMDGVRLAREIRTNIPSYRLPLVIMVATGAPRRAVEAERLDVRAILSKPLRSTLLHEVLVAAVDHRTPILRLQPPPRTPVPARVEHTLRILLAEDNPFNQRVARLMLGKLGQQITIVTNGLEVLDALARETFDVVLMDVQMPEMDGVTATREIRARLAPDRRPRIVAMTANALAGDRERYLADGMDDYISKPIREQELLRVLLACRPLG